MQLNLTGHHVDLTTPMRDYVNSKMERLERHFDHVTDIHVVLSVEKQRHKAEATMNVSGGEKLTDHHRSEGSISRDL
jgi:putative sigma-54 modulation protein